MASYRVVWTIDIEADTPRQAAEKALEIQRDSDSMATCFEVDVSPGYGHVDSNMIQIDLSRPA